MFEKVLVALDFSPYSQKILDRITQIPGIQEVILLHVVDATRPSRREWTCGQHIENVKVLMAEKKKSLENFGLKVHTKIDAIVNEITQGTISHVILEIAETESVSLIVMGARGINPIQELLLGSVSSFVLRHAKTNVLIMHFAPVSSDRKAALHRPSSMKLFSKILVPTDFSQAASDAASFVKTIPGIEQVVLLHVVNRGDSQQEIDNYVKETQSHLDEMKKEFICAGVEVNLHVRVGDPTEMILSVTDEDDVSLIAMSAHGKGWLHDLLLGSTTFTVARKTKTPILVLRTGQET
jgi:nucleotide-binding universal stress UspA family protein